MDQDVIKLADKHEAANHTKIKKKKATFISDNIDWAELFDSVSVENLFKWHDLLVDATTQTTVGEGIKVALDANRNEMRKRMK